MDIYSNVHDFIHIYRTNYNVAQGQETTIMGLFDACVKNLQDQGMKKMFLDGVSHGVDRLKQLGILSFSIRIESFVFNTNLR